MNSLITQFRFALFSLGLLIASASVSVSAPAVTLVDRQGRTVVLKERRLPHRHDECQLCHRPKQRDFIGKKTKTEIEHVGILPVHGRASFACQNCHDINNHNFLRASTGVPTSFEKSSGVCQRCHANQYRDWRDGIHGKRIGYWNGQRTQYHCIDCHNPHAVRFEEMMTVAEPPVPRFLIPKDEEHE